MILSDIIKSSLSCLLIIKTLIDHYAIWGLIHQYSTISPKTIIIKFVIVKAHIACLLVMIVIIKTILSCVLSSTQSLPSLLSSKQYINHYALGAFS
jgi:hypothetical protein